MKYFVLGCMLCCMPVSRSIAQETIRIDDFESGNRGWTIVDPGWMTMDIVDNPAKDGINSSDKVARCIRKPASNVWAGAILRGKYQVPVGGGKNEYRFARVKFLKTSAGDVGFKIERGPGNKTFGVNVPYRPDGKWQEIVFDLGGAAPGTYQDFFFMVDQTDHPSEDIVVYVDDIVLATDPDATDGEDNRPGEYELVWQDEFDGTDPDLSKWSYETGTGDWGWGNNEAQYYTDRRENVFLRDGNLVIKAIKESYRGSEYTSGRILTRGKASWLYGRMEARIKLPRGRGIWPAFWMMPLRSVYGGWPKSGEIDIMEYVGYQPSTVHGTVHTEGASGGSASGASIYRAGAEEDFHRITLEWTPDYLKWFYDDEPAFKTYRRLSGWTSVFWPFDQEFYIILNLAVGGNWGGAQGIDDSIFPQEFQVDYVRVYQKIESSLSARRQEADGPFAYIKDGFLQVVQGTECRHFMLYDLEGRMVLEQEVLDSWPVTDVSGLPKGVYILTLIGGDRSKVCKVVK